MKLPWSPVAGRRRSSRRAGRIDRGRCRAHSRTIAAREREVASDAILCATRRGGEPALHGVLCTSRDRRILTLRRIEHTAADGRVVLGRGVVGAARDRGGNAARRVCAASADGVAGAVGLVVGTACDRCRDRGRMIAEPAADRRQIAGRLVVARRTVEQIFRAAAAGNGRTGARCDVAGRAQVDAGGLAEGRRGALWAEIGRTAVVGADQEGLVVQRAEEVGRRIGAGIALGVPAHAGQHRLGVEMGRCSERDEAAAGVGDLGFQRHRRGVLQIEPEVDLDREVAILHVHAGEGGGCDDAAGAGGVEQGQAQVIAAVGGLAAVAEGPTVGPRLRVGGAGHQGQGDQQTES